MSPRNRRAISLKKRIPPCFMVVPGIIKGII
jgi:hypothetical protein